MLAQIRDDTAHGQDLLRERRERSHRRGPAWRAQQPRGDVECHVVAVADGIERVRGLDGGDAEVDAVAEEDAGEALRDDGSDPELLQRRNGVLARRTAAKVLATHE